MAHRVPLIATAVGDVPELLDHGRAGLLVPPNNAAAISVAALSMLARSARARGFADHAHTRYRERFTLEIMRQRVDERYSLATSANRSRASSVRCQG